MKSVPKIVGLTGGIGSGKTTVANIFKSLGVSVYIADDEAKALMNRSKVIKRKLVQMFGEDAYVNGVLNKPFIANKIFYLLVIIIINIQFLIYFFIRLLYYKIHR